MSKNRRFSEKERERETKSKNRDESSSGRRRRRRRGRGRGRGSGWRTSILSLSLSLTFFDARVGKRASCVLAFIFVFYLIFPCFKSFPKKRLRGKREMRRLQTLLFLVLFAFFAEQTTIASEEDEEEATTTTTATSKCLDRGYDPDVIRCDYCRYAMKDALGGEHDELVRECLECCKENNEDGDSSSMTRESGVKFDRATITACS